MEKSIQKAIKFFGSQQKLATLTGVSQGMVAKWKRGGSKPSLQVSIKIEMASKGEIKAIKLRPDCQDVLEYLTKK